MDASRIILGFTGSIGSGCSYIANDIANVSDIKYKYYKLSDIIRERLLSEGIKKPTTDQMQNKGNELRKKSRRNGFLIQELFRKIDKEKKLDESDAIIIDGIKNIGEIQTLRQFPFFLLFSVQSYGEIRCKRYIDDGGTKNEFFNADKRDQLEGPGYGQQVNPCNYLADIIILNDEVIPAVDTAKKRQFVTNIYTKYVKLIENLRFGRPSLDIKPTIDELCMTLAYSLSKMSSCVKRKVGSVIVRTEKAKTLKSENSGKVISLPFIVSSGYNEVPLGSNKCIYHPDYEMCYRDYLQQIHARKIKYCPNCGEKIIIKVACPSCEKIFNKYVKFCPECKKEIEDTFKCKKCGYEVFKKFLPGENETPGKLLDMCRSLHAEENALLNLVGSGNNSQRENLTLYVTTQPCNLCANKIVTVGIKKVVYDEPYPMKDSQDILDKGDVTTKRFEGVKSTSYFGLYQ